MQIKYISALLAGTLALTSITPAFAAEDRPTFEDVASDAWYYEAVSTLAANGTMVGIDASHFAPQMTLTREMFVTLLGRMANVNPADYTVTPSFNDVTSDSWYAPYVQWSKECGITSGLSSDTFGTGCAISREQMATLTARFLEQLPLLALSKDATVKPFADQNATSYYAQEAVHLMHQYDLFEGDATHCFYPQKTATRAECAVLLSRLTTLLTQSPLDWPFKNVSEITLQDATLTPPRTTTLTTSDAQAVCAFLQKMPLTAIESIPAHSGWRYRMSAVCADGTFQFELGNNWVTYQGMRYHTTEDYLTPLISHFS